MLKRLKLAYDIAKVLDAKVEDVFILEVRWPCKAMKSFYASYYIVFLVSMAKPKAAEAKKKKKAYYSKKEKKAKEVKK